MDGQEILDLAHRHEHHLKGLRLRQVHLKQDSMPWKEVLKELRDSMQLQWLSLFGIGYAPPDGSSMSGSEIPDGPLLNDTDSESEENTDEPVA